MLGRESAARPLVLIGSGLVLAAGTIAGIALARTTGADAGAGAQACIALAIDRDTGLTRAVPCTEQPMLLATREPKR